MTESVGTEFWLHFFKNAGIPDDDAIQYVELFEDHRIQKNMLLELSKTILQDMGINMAGDIIAILRHAKMVHAQELRKNSVNKPNAVRSSASAPVLSKSAAKRSAIHEINEWIKIPGKTQLVKKESYETKQYSDHNQTSTKVSLRSSPELSSGIGLGQWGLNVTKKQRTVMDTGSSPPPERYEKTGEDAISRKRSSTDAFKQPSKRQPSGDDIQSEKKPKLLSIGDQSDPTDAHHSVFERLDHSIEDKTSSVQLKTNTNQQHTKHFEDKLHRVALTAVLECLNERSKPATGNKGDTAALPMSRSQPELRQQTTDGANMFDRLTEINTSRERHKLPSQPVKKTPASSPSSVPRKVKLRMDTIDQTVENRGKLSRKQDIMTRLGKQSVFTRLNN